MDLTDPQQMHGYTYANNPLTWSDPDGLIPSDCMEHDCYGYVPTWNGGCPYGSGTTKNVKWGKKHRKRSTKQRKPGQMRPVPGANLGTCAGGKGDKCTLNDDEAKAKEELDGILKEHGADRDLCLPLNVYCQNAGDRPGDHEIAMCRKMGLTDCKAMYEAMKMADELAGPFQVGSAALAPVFGNAKHHSLWMALAVANGVNPDDARLMGFAP